MTTKKRSLIMSVLALLLSVALFAAGTYALFSDQVDLTNHLQAGTLDITLKRTNLKVASLDNQTGFLKLSENPEDIDFSNPPDPNDPDAKNKNVFDISDGALIVPGCWYEAEMQIINNSDVAFGYWLEFDFKNEEKLALADQIMVTVTTVKDNNPEGESLSKKVGEGKYIGSVDMPIGILAKAGAEQVDPGYVSSQIFTVRIEFIDDDAVNNLAKNQKLDFDIIVKAVQIADAPTSD